MPRALILFDFDGTLVDTAPALVTAANQQRVRRGLSPLPYERLGAVAGQGTQALLQRALDITPDHPEFEALKAQFLAYYALSASTNTQLFPGISALLDQLSHHGYAWGIVTNKLTHLTLPLASSLGLTQKSSVIVCGDTTPRPKPYPDPLLYAARQAGYTPSQCIYIGDDLRDVQAAHAAGMPIVASGYGYLGADKAIILSTAEKYVRTVDGLWVAIRALLQESGNILEI